MALISDWSSTSCPKLCCTPWNSFQETWSHHANSRTVTLASHAQLYQIHDTSVNLLSLTWVITFLYNRNVATLQTIKKLKMTIPSAKLKKYGCRSFSFAAPTIWNSEAISNHDDISKFKTSIKTFLFKEHFN